MVNRSEIENEVRTAASEAAKARGIELVHVEFAGAGHQAAVRIFIDKEGGVDHNDCSVISQDVERFLDERDPIHGRYVLEVSSPGIERGLYSASDFARFAGEAAKVKTGTAIDGQRNFRGRIISVEDGEIVFEDRTSGIVRIPWESVAKANLEFDIERELKEAKKRKS